MKFSGKFRTTPVCRALPEVNLEYLIQILKDVSWQVGDETRERLRAAIKSPRQYTPPQDGRISFRDTPVFGYFYVYLWFDAAGDLFYIGKGTGNRAESWQGRSAAFKEKAANGYYKILATDINEGYALDLEKILLLECIWQRKNLTNRKYADALDAIQYCSRERDVLLYYWDHLGVISRFSELTGIEVLYDARDCSLFDTLENRCMWWENYRDARVNNPRILNEIREAEERKQRQKEKRREYAQRRKEKQCRKTAERQPSDEMEGGVTWKAC